MVRASREDPARSVSQLAQHAGIIRTDGRPASTTPTSGQSSREQQEQNRKPDGFLYLPKPPIVSSKGLYVGDEGKTHSPLGPSTSTISLPSLRTQPTSSQAKDLLSETSFSSSILLEASKSLAALPGPRNTPPPTITRKPSPPVLAAFNPKDHWLQKPYNLNPATNTFPALSQSVSPEPSSNMKENLSEASKTGQVHLRNESWTEVTSASSRLSFYAQTSHSKMEKDRRNSASRTEEATNQEEDVSSGAHKMPGILVKKAWPLQQQRDSPGLNESRQTRNLLPGRRRSSQQETDTLAALPLEKDLLEGFLAPENLQAYGLGKDECYRLFRALRVYSLGFQEVVLELLQHLADRKEVMLHVWRVFAKLWDSATFTRFESEVISIATERDCLRSQQLLLQENVEQAKIEIRTLKEAQSKLVTQVLQRAVEGNNTEQILLKATLESEELRGKLAVTESRAFYESKAKVEAQDKVTATWKALVEEKEARALDRATSQEHVSSLEAERARLIQEKEACLSTLVDVQNRFGIERSELKVAVRTAENEVARALEEARKDRMAADEARTRVEAAEMKEKDAARAKVLLQGDLHAVREQYEAEKARTAELTQRLAVSDENVRFMAHQIEELKSSLEEARVKLEESVRKAAEKDVQLEERTQTVLRTQTEMEDKKRQHEAAVKVVEDRLATAREHEVAQRVKKKRYKNKLADAEQELVKWKADIETADNMYRQGQAVLEKVAQLQTLVNEAALREAQLRKEKQDLIEALRTADDALLDTKAEMEAARVKSDEAMKQVLVAAKEEKEEYTRKAEDNFAAAMRDLKVLETLARSLEKQVASRDDEIKGLQRDIRRNENATKVLVREKELLVTKLNEATIRFEAEMKSREETYAINLSEVSGRLEKAEQDLNASLNERHVEREASSREKEDLTKAKGETEDRAAALARRVNGLEKDLEQTQWDLMAAKNDAIDLEANLSRMLENAEAERAQLGARASTAIEGRLAECEAEIVRSRERMLTLEAELDVARRDARFRLRCLQSMLNQLRDCTSQDASFIADDIPRTVEAEEAIAALVEGVITEVDWEEHHKEANEAWTINEPRPSETIRGLVGEVVNEIELEAHNEAADEASTGGVSGPSCFSKQQGWKGLVHMASNKGTLGADTEGFRIFEDLTATWKATLGLLSSKAEATSGLQEDIKRLEAEVQELLGKHSSLQAQLSQASKPKISEAAHNTRFAEALLKKREQRAGEELKAAIARADALESELSDVRRLLKEKQRAEESRRLDCDESDESRGEKRRSDSEWNEGKKEPRKQVANLETELEGGDTLHNHLMEQMHGERTAENGVQVQGKESTSDKLLRKSQSIQSESVDRMLKDAQVGQDIEDSNDRGSERKPSAEDDLKTLQAKIGVLQAEKDELAEAKMHQEKALAKASEDKGALERRVESMSSELEEARQEKRAEFPRELKGKISMDEETLTESKSDTGVSEDLTLRQTVEILENEKRALHRALENFQAKLGVFFNATNAPGASEKSETLETELRTATASEDVRVEERSRHLEAIEKAAALVEQIRAEAASAKEEAAKARQLLQEEAEHRKAEAEQRQAEAEQRKAEADQRKAVEVLQKAEVEQWKAEAEHFKAEAEQRKAEADQREAEEVLQKAEVEQLKGEAEHLKAEAEQRKAEVEELLEAKQAAAEAQEALAEVRAEQHKKTLVNLWTGTVPKTGGTVITIQYSLRTLRVLISQIYCDKIAADIADDRESGGQRQDMKEFVYDFFLFKFGLRAFAELHLLSVLKAFEEYSGTNQRLMLFGAFIGFAGAAPPLPTDALDFFLLFLSRLFAETDGPNTSEFEEGRSDVGVEAAIKVATSCFPGPASEGLTARARALGTRTPKPMIDFDVLAGLVMDTWQEEQRKMDHRIGDLFRQADENGDGVLSYSEFSAIVRQIDGGVTERAVKSMFREALLDSNSGSRILPASFEKVARAHGLAGHVPRGSHVAISKPCKHDDLALLKDSWTIVAPLIREQVGTLKKESSLSSELRDLESQVEGLQAMLRMSNNEQAPQVWQLYRRIMLGFQIQNQRVELRAREEKRVQLGASAFQTLFR